MLTVIAICIGACVGALSRWQLGLWLSHSHALIPWGTLAANLIGGYLVGVCVGVFQQMPELDPIWRLALVWFSGRADHLLQLFSRGGQHAAASALRTGLGHHQRAPVGLAGVDRAGAQDGCGVLGALSGL